MTYLIMTLWAAAASFGMAALVAFWFSAVGAQPWQTIRTAFAASALTSAIWFALAAVLA